MATVYKRANSPNYHIRFAHNGKEYRESAHTTSRKQAELFMNQRIKEIKGSGGYMDLFTRMVEEINNLPLSKQKKVKQDIVNQLLQDTSTLLIKDAFNVYKAKPNKKKKSADTIKRQQAWFNSFIEWLNSNHKDIEYLNQITHKMADEYSSELYNQFTSATYNKRVSFFKTLFKKLKLDASLAHNVWDEVERLTNDTEISREPLTYEEFSKLLEAADGEWKTLILIGFYTGLRLKDVALMKSKSINILDSTINLTVAKTKYKLKQIPIYHQLLEAISSNYDANREYLLPNIANQYNQDARKITDKVKELIKSIGLETNQERESGKRKASVRGFHSLRHTFVSMCASEGIPQSVVQSLVGTTTKAVMEIYTHTSPEQKKDAIKLLPDVTELIK
jgi:integrase